MFISTCLCVSGPADSLSWTRFHVCFKRMDCAFVRSVHKCLLGQVCSVVQVFCRLADYLSSVSILDFKLQITVLVHQ